MSADEIVAAGFTEGKKAAISPSAFIQWKGTNVCMDFHCECGADCHFDGDCAYAVQCPHCQTIWEMPYVIYPRKVPSHHIVQVMEKDEDYGTEG